MKEKDIVKDFKSFFEVRDKLQEVMKLLPAKSPKGRYLYKKVDAINLEVEKHLTYLAQEFFTLQEHERELIRNEKILYSNILKGVTEE